MASQTSYWLYSRFLSSILDLTRGLEPDVIVAVLHFVDGVLFARQFAESCIKVKFIAGAGAYEFTNPDSMRVSGEPVLYYTNTCGYNPYRKQSKNIKLVNRFMEWYGKSPTEATGVMFYSLFIMYGASRKRAYSTRGFR